MQPGAAEKRRSGPHMNGTQVPGMETFVCDECKRRGVTCGGIWRFHSQHERYLLQCRTCRQKKRGCSFRKLENNGKPQSNPTGRKDVAKGKRRQRSPSVISISDSEDDEESQVVGPSSRPGKRAKFEDEDKDEDNQDMWKDLLEARKRKVEIETIAEKAAIDAERSASRVKKSEKDLAVLNATIDGLERRLKGRK